jgi:hypothetical protein
LFQYLKKAKMCFSTVLNKMKLKKLLFTWRKLNHKKARIKNFFLFIVHVSPSAMIAMWRYLFRLSRYVYGGNRSFAPILSVYYPMFERVQRDQNTWTQFRIRIVLFSFEQQINKESMRNETNNNKINSRTMNKNKWTANNE